MTGRHYIVIIIIIHLIICYTVSRCNCIYNDSRCSIWQTRNVGRCPTWWPPSRIYTASQQNVPPLQLAIIFTYTVRLTGSAEAQVIWGGIVKRFLISYFIGNISAKKYQNPFTRATLTRDKVAACNFIVARCDSVARQSRATKSRDKIAGVTWH